MNKTLLLLAALGLCACSKDNMPLIGATSATPNSNAVLFVGTGQSQMSQETNLAETFPNAINIAVGGSPLSSWQKGGVNYPKIINACANRKMPCVLLFWQGEEDAREIANASTWGPRFLVMVDSLREDLGYEVKVVYVQLGQLLESTKPDFPHNLADFPYWSTVKDQQALVNGARPHLVMIKSDDLAPELGDGIHYALAQYKIFQARMLIAWQGMGA